MGCWIVSTAGLETAHLHATITHPDQFDQSNSWTNKTSTGQMQGRKGKNKHVQFHVNDTHQNIAGTFKSQVSFLLFCILVYALHKSNVNAILSSEMSIQKNVYSRFSPLESCDKKRQFWYSAKCKIMLSIPIHLTIKHNL